MLKFRLIARLDIRNEHLIKTIRLEGVRKVGDPGEFARRYDEAGIDEILYIDTVASLYGRNHLADLLAHTADRCFVPLCVAGGIGSCGDVRSLLLAGADKLAVNTAALARPDLINEIAAKFGSSTLAIQIDAKRRGNGWEAYTHGGRQPSGRDAIAWAREACERGAGEVLVTSIDREGARLGCDLSLGRAAARGVRQPVVLAGGLDTADHVVAAARAGVQGLAMAGALHYDRVSLPVMRAALEAAGVATRPNP